MRRSWIAAAVVGQACVLNPEYDAPGEVDSTGQSTSASTSSGDDTDGPSTGLGELCPPLPAPQGDVITVGPQQAAELASIIDDAPAGATVELLPGTYVLTRGVFMDAAGVSVRSSTGDPQDVVIDGSSTDDNAFFVQASDVTLAEMTLRGSAGHLIQVVGAPGADVVGFSAYRLRLLDPTYDAVRANAANGTFADAGTVACSSITLTDQGRPLAGSECLPAAISGYGVAGWEIRDNHIEGFWCPTGLTHAISFNEGSADHVIERNTVLDCNIGIQLGIWEVPIDGIRTIVGPAECAGTEFDHYGGVVRNNMIAAVGQGIAASEAGFFSGVALWQVCGTAVVHNTIASAIGALGSVEYRFARSQQKVLNNLVTDPFRDRDGADAPIAGNLELVDLSSFVNPLGGDLHLVPDAAAIDAGVQLGADALAHDIDGDPRNNAPDVGADEA